MLLLIFLQGGGTLVALRASCATAAVQDSKKAER